MKLPFPKFDADLVEAIEDHLHLAEHTETMTTHEGNAGEGLDSVISVGWGKNANNSTYFRPMFQVLVPGGTIPVLTVRPCARCLDFSRSWNCPDHPEKPITEFPWRKATLERARPVLDAAIERWLSVEISGHRVTTAAVPTVNGEFTFSFEVEGS